MSDKFDSVDIISDTLSFAVLPIDMSSGSIIQDDLRVMVHEKKSYGVINNSGYYLFFNLDPSLKYTLSVGSQSNYTGFQNSIDLKTFDFENINPNFKDEVAVISENSNMNSDRTVFAYLNNKVSLIDTLKKNKYLVKNICIYPSTKTVLIVNLHKLDIAQNPFAANFEIFEKPVFSTMRFNRSLRLAQSTAKVVLRKSINPLEPSQNILVNPDSYNSNSFTFSSLDKRSVGENMIDTKTKLKLRNYLKFINIDNNNHPNNNNIDNDDSKFSNIDIVLIIDRLELHGDEEVVIPDFKIEKDMTTIINILIID